MCIWHTRQLLLCVPYALCHPWVQPESSTVWAALQSQAQPWCARHTDKFLLHRAKWKYREEHIHTSHYSWKVPTEQKLKWNFRSSGTNGERCTASSGFISVLWQVEKISPGNSVKAIGVTVFCSLLPWVHMQNLRMMCTRVNGSFALDLCTYLPLSFSK